MIIKSHLYGSNPRDILIVSLENTSILLYKIDLNYINQQLKDFYIKQSDIKTFIDELENKAEVCFYPKDILQFAKDNLIKEIDEYDQSDNVNQFLYKDIPLWINGQTRSNLITRFNAEESLGKTDTVLWINNISLPIKINQGKTMIYAIENYASNCYDVTARHKAEVLKLKTLDEVVKFDYKKDYPEKLKLS